MMRTCVNSAGAQRQGAATNRVSSGIKCDRSYTGRRSDGDGFPGAAEDGIVPIRPCQRTSPVGVGAVPVVVGVCIEPCLIRRNGCRCTSHGAQGIEQHAFK